MLSAPLQPAVAEATRACVNRLQGGLLWRFWSEGAVNAVATAASRKKRRLSRGILRSWAAALAHLQSGRRRVIRRRRCYVTACHAPGALLTRPYSRIAVGPVNGCTIDLDNEARPKCDDCHLGTDAANAQLSWIVTGNSDNAGLVGRKVLRLSTQLPVGAGEEKVLGNEPVERLDISRELCPSQVGFESHDFWVAEPHQDSLENVCVCVCTRHI